MHLQGKIFLYRFLLRFSMRCPSLRENVCLHSCCCNDSNSSQNPPYKWILNDFKLKIRQIFRTFR